MKGLLMNGYYADPAGHFLSALDRMFYAGGAYFQHKPGAAIVTAQRAGTTASLDVLNKYFTAAQQGVATPVAETNHWTNFDR